LFLGKSFRNSMEKFFSPEKLADFDNHKLIVFLEDESKGLRGFITIHRGGNIYPSFGATRFWRYKSDIEALTDCLKLSKIMSYKSALAGLKYGGAKAVIIHQRNSRRNDILRAYVQRVNALGGKFITGADVGINGKDVELLRLESNYIVGTKSDPVKFTSLGILFAIQTCLKQILGGEDIGGKTFAIQGIGKTGSELLRLIYPFAEKIYVSDIDALKLKLVKKRFPKVIILSPQEIYRKKVDIFCPCALSDAITKKNVSFLRCKVIAGSANNQLEDDTVGELLQKMGILYAPDYVINAGGLIAVVDEFENKSFNESKIEKKIKKIKKRLQFIFDKNKKTNRATNIIANNLAEKIFNKFI